ncbi:hypothetical protein FIBSPDRAFT_846265 [Athelia psychrophila]|uniref:Uncharacterized protein n=1 Tax=Athelia psychrophila TaxID=1759441 RepID=A0A166WVW8_9AGAM|nr:hypothetical protein FIBSPDRAFT_846265 [Fibularhizoctonia sp. CBS 109695]
MRFAIATILTGAGFAAAQSLSSSCQKTLKNVLAANDTACLNPSGLVSIVGAVSNSSSTSLVGPLNTWLTGLCAQPQCSNATLSALVTNITTGCSTELNAAGLGVSDPASLTALVEQYYPAVRQAACLKDTSKSTLCATELLTDIQNQVGTLSLTNIIKVVPEIASGSVTIPSNVTCSDCTKQVYNIANQQFPSLIQGEVASVVGGACGATFTNGAAPTEITEIASTSTAVAGLGASTNGGSLVSVNTLVAVAMTGLVAVSSAFAVLA